MTKKALLLVSVPVLVLGMAALADWEPSDGHKMHYPQLPDSTGWTVCATVPVNLADDFMCTETGWIKDIHFWGSWRHGEPGVIQQFILRLHVDIPADQSETGYSMPGEVLHELSITSWSEVPHNPPTLEGWYNPMTNFVFPDDHYLYYQYNVFLDQDDWFHQDSGTIYWLSISAIVEDPINSQWGWKSSLDHWNDNATFGDIGDDFFEEMYEPDPVDTLVDSFYISIDDFGSPVNWGGVGHWSSGWAGWGLDGEPWWLIWYYDHPVDYDRWKQVLLEFDAARYQSSSWPGYVEICVAWSIDTWPSVYYPPPPQMADSIDHVIVFADSVLPETTSFSIPMEIWEYNPEWVAVGVHATHSDNVEITNGAITHICAPKVIEPLDLAFVITDGVAQSSDCIPPMRGSVDYDPRDITDISDLVYLVDYMFTGGPAPVCFEEADMDCTGGILDIADLVYLVDYMFNQGPPPCRCDCADCP